MPPSAPLSASPGAGRASVGARRFGALCIDSAGNHAAGPAPAAPIRAPALRANLTNSSASTPCRTQRPVPAALIFTPTVALPEALLPAGELQAEAPLLLWGPFNEDPARLIPRVDLTNRTSALVAVGATGQVFVQRLVSTGLGQPTPGARGAESTTICSAC